MKKQLLYRPKWFSRVAAFLLLLVYLSSTVSFDFIHQLAHQHHHDELHSHENELDACHRRIFHGDETNGCNHKAHFVPVEEDCELCELLVQQEDYIEVERNIPILSLINIDQPDFATLFDFTYFSTRQARAPPVS